MPAPLTEEALAELKGKHGEVYELTAASGEAVVVKPPTRGLYRRFRAQSQDDRKREVAVENLVRDCLVYPDAATFEALLDKRPGLLDSFGVALIELAGLSQSVEKKAL